MSEAQEAITQWLTMLRKVLSDNGLPESYHYAGVGDFLIQHAMWYEPRPLPKRIRRGVPKRCFGNAVELAKTRGYGYVEGYAVADIGIPLPIHHAWNLDLRGNLIDNTWEDTGLAYFGVQFPLKVAIEAIRYQENTVLDNPRSRFELYKTPFGKVTK